MRAIRRVHASSIKDEEVSARSRHAIIPRRSPARRPIVAVLASEPRLTIEWSEVPAAHEVRTIRVLLFLQHYLDKSYAIIETNLELGGKNKW